MIALIKKKMIWIVRRHPILYYIRFILISKNRKQNCINNVGCFNDINKKEDVPQLFFEVNERIPFSEHQDEFDKALTIARFLRENIKGGPGLGLSSKTTLQKMLDSKGGVCSDFSIIFCIFCLINDIKVKEWGCVEKFYKNIYGHSFNEVYSPKYEKWIAVDVNKGMCFNTSESDNPLSAFELFQYLREGNTLQMNFFSDFRPDNIQRLHQVYSKSSIPFIIINYRIKDNDYYLNKFEDRFPPFFTNAILILLGKNHQFLFVIDNYKKKLLPGYFQS